MANEIHAKLGAIATLTIRPDFDASDLANGLPDTENRCSTVVTGGTAPQVRVFYKVTTANTPTTNTLIEFYLSVGSTGATDLVTAGGTDVDGNIASFDKNQALFLHAQVTTGTSGASYIGSFVFDNPGDDWRLIVVNETGAALSSTQADHVIQYRTITPEVQ